MQFLEDFKDGAFNNSISTIAAIRDSVAHCTELYAQDRHLDVHSAKHCYQDASPDLAGGHVCCSGFELHYSELFSKLFLAF